MYNTISFYRYTDVDNPEKLLIRLRGICNKFHLLGRILLGKEGINGAVCGTSENIEQFKHELQKLFPDLTFREQKEDHNTYHKLVVRVRDEIVGLGVDVDLKNRGEHVTPEEFNEIVKENKEVVILDARNDYEAEVGKFKDALALPIKTFREFPEAMEKREDLKDKKVVMYCTGGVRCERASAYLKEQGFKDVSQLQGGIINYVNQFPDKYFEGNLYVFDDRKVAKVSKGVISKCELCEEKCDEMINCHNLDCDKLMVCCAECQSKLKNTCSEKCMTAPRQRQEKQLDTQETIDSRKAIGKIKNFYPKAKVVLVELNKDLKKNSKIKISGNTTEEFEETIEEIRDYDGNIIAEAKKGDLVTFAVSKKARENDLCHS
jgi:UPF0176 protein